MPGMAYAIAVVMVCCGLAVTEGATPATVDFKGTLFRSILSGGYSAPSAADQRRMSPELTGRLHAFLVRTKHVKSRLHPPESAYPEDKERFSVRQEIERAIVALVDDPGIAREAAFYAKDAVFAYEYEADSGGPTGEAQYAEAYLAKHPQTPMAPFLDLFLAHRYRALYETEVWAKNVEGEKRAARKYREAIQQARASDDLLIRAAADDLDRQPYVYMDPSPSPHPRAFQ
jgi:hypothetical protein